MDMYPVKDSEFEVDAQDVKSKAGEPAYRPLGFGKMVMAVFLGNLLFGIVAAIVYSGLR